jgi:choline dehydrogenase-like flavoprotein
VIDDIVSARWDVAVIGAGMGGGTAARRLAESGLRVLILEFGPSGRAAEAQGITFGVDDPGARLVRGFWPTRAKATIDGEETEFFAPLGAGVGGSSVFYAAALERLARHDFEDVPGLKHPTGGWPVGHDVFARWYEEAERLYSVCGTPDPLNPEDGKALRAPPPLSDADQAMTAAFRKAGLHPYRMHVAIRFIDGCKECVGFKCPYPCKMDGRSAGVAPALATGRAALIDRCVVERLIAKDGRVTAVEARKDDRLIRISADRIVVAAGGYGTPRLLLASASEAAPNGLANESGLVGRNLMFHLTERAAVWPRYKGEFKGPFKTLALRDFYAHDGDRLGLFHSMGVTLSYGNIMYFLTQRFDQSPFRRMRAVRELLRIPAIAASRLLGKAQLYSTLIEDLPHAENRVLFDAAEPHRVIFQYAIAEDLKERRKRFRKLISRALKSMPHMWVANDAVLELGHPCGTARFGTDPRTSVLDPSCRAHGVNNLYVADSAFMPTSGGVNPSLTIAANALRVADEIVKRAAADGVAA